MKEKRGRFRKLECAPLLKVFRKRNSELKRFERLEVDGHKLKIEITHKVDPAKGFRICPKCNKRNPANSLYCLYCSFIFDSVAQEVPDAKLEPYQKICPQCQRICVRSQRSCVYCGFVFAPDDDGIPTGSGWNDNKVVDLREESVITVNIDGVVYRSTDPGLPNDIRGLMQKIRREGYSKEMVDAWVRDKTIERDLELQHAQEQLRQAKLQFWLRIVQVAGVLLFFLLIFVLTVRGR